VDLTKVVLAIRLHTAKSREKHQTGIEYNQDLVRRHFNNKDPKDIGVVENCEMELVPKGMAMVVAKDAAASTNVGQCPSCVLRRGTQSLGAMLLRHHESQNVIVATVDAGYVAFALNWACSLRRLGIQNFLFHAVDDDIFQALQDMNLPVVKYLSATSLQYKKGGKADGVVYGSVSYQSIMNTRTEFIATILEEGYNVLLSDVDIVFLRSPFPHFDPMLDIQGGAHKELKITGGFIYTRATPNSVKLWKKVLEQHSKIFAKIQSMKKFDIHSYTEQEILNNVLLKSAQGEYKWGRIPQNIVADGKQFFIDRETQKKGEWPAVIHNNYVIGAENKLQRFRNTSLWLINDNLQCRGFLNALPPIPPPGFPTFSIKILTFNRPAALERLLASLLEADIVTNTEISLDIFVDYPDEVDEMDPNIMGNRTLVWTLLFLNCCYLFFHSLSLSLL